MLMSFPRKRESRYVSPEVVPGIRNSLAVSEIGPDTAVDPEGMLGFEVFDEAEVSPDDGR